MDACDRCEGADTEVGGGGTSMEDVDVALPMPVPVRRVRLPPRSLCGMTGCQAFWP